MLRLAQQVVPELVGFMVISLGGVVVVVDAHALRQAAVVGARTTRANRNQRRNRADHAERGDAPANVVSVERVDDAVRVLRGRVQDLERQLGWRMQRHRSDRDRDGHVVRHRHDDDRRVQVDEPDIDVSRLTERRSWGSCVGVVEQDRTRAAARDDASVDAHPLVKVAEDRHGVLANASQQVHRLDTVHALNWQGVEVALETVGVERHVGEVVVEVVVELDDVAHHIAHGALAHGARVAREPRRAHLDEGREQFRRPAVVVRQEQAAALRVVRVVGDAVHCFVGRR
mmetsp:Transcript_6990/g.24859  ORF Transcript_6990/g.24859 Transcript_6990/m.24859 type:complete len:286 (+) Transcript_6990:1119-1976(+)